MPPIEYIPATAGSLVIFQAGMQDLIGYHVAQIEAGEALIMGHYAMQDYVYQLPDGTVFTIEGNDLVPDATGRLIAGTITGLDDNQPYNRNSSYSGFQLTASALQATAPVALSATLMASGNNTVIVGQSNPFTIAGSGNTAVFQGTYAVGGLTNGGNISAVSSLSIDGGDSLDTMIFNGFRSDANVAANNTSQTVTYAGLTNGQGTTFPNLTASLVGFDTLSFIDGSTFTDTLSVGAQSDLLFRGLLGRDPGPIVLGVLANAAVTDGSTGIAQALLGSQEGAADDGSLTNTQYIGRLYQTVLGRNADVVGQAGWTQQLDTGALSRAAVAVYFTSSQEAATVNAHLFTSGVFAANPQAVEIQRIFIAGLGHLQTNFGIAGNLAELNGGESLLAYEQKIVTSPEFISKGPQDNASFVNQVQQTATGMIDPAATATYAAQLAAGTITRGGVLDAYTTAQHVTDQLNLVVSNNGVMHA